MAKHLLITGANRGIGLTMVKHYLADGWLVTACCRAPEQAEELQSLLDDNEGLSIFQLDVTDYEAIDELAENLNGEPIDLLINNAGYYGPKGVGFGGTDVEEWRQVFEINTIAPLKIAEAFKAHLSQADHGIYAAISSKMGSMSDNGSGGSYIYRSSKAALNSVVKSLSIDLQPDNISAIAIHPGWVQTDMGGPNALITTEQSVSGIKQLLDNLSTDQNGGFYDYNGSEIAW
ncbi:SDR family oxidoreductase [uncultured Shewanella sp.]|uniref:SDR family oxidoreductase n=1 Tax=Shewanella atlantica TaxID=271099 RepID=UPI00262CD4FB|nr:SDR family oxidoreductase [uncultured Shewanella sp.]